MSSNIHSGGGSSWAVCNHTGIVQILPHKDAFKTPGYLWGASEYQIKGACQSGWRPDLVLSLNGTISPVAMSTGISINSGALALLPPESVIRPLLQPVNRMILDWPDGDGGPEFTTIEFWKEIAALLKSGKHIAMHCAAGHGRTGTAAASILHALGMTDDPVKFLRDNYCKKAVETEDQIKYLTDLGVKTKEKPSGFTPTSTVFQGSHFDTKTGVWVDTYDRTPGSFTPDDKKDKKDKRPKRGSWRD